MNRTVPAARWVLWLILLGAFALMLKLNLPGHMTVDSVLALHEGRFGVRTTWNPAFFGWLLGVLDRIRPGTSLAVALCGALLFGGWALMAAARPRTSWLAPILALGLVALPQVLVYPGIVWKDVQFAVAALAGFALLTFGVRDPGRPTPWLSLGLAAVLFAAAGLLRQNGLIMAMPAALAIAWARSGCGGWPRSIALAVGWLGAVAAMTLVLSAVAQPQGAGAPDDAGAKGLRILGIYDVIGASSLVDGRATPLIDRAAPAAGAYIRQHADTLYSPERVDMLSLDPNLGPLLARIPSEVVRDEWLRLIREDPVVYLRVRLQVFGQVLGTPVIDRCLPAAVGIEGPKVTLDALRIPSRVTVENRRLFNYVTWYLDTPGMSHVAFALTALAAGVFLLIRREPADLAVLGLVAGGLGFAASFFVLSIACDYRYLYALDLSAISGLLYVAMDPRLRRR